MSRNLQDPVQFAEPEKKSLNLRRARALLERGRGLSLEQLYLFTFHLEIMLRCGINLVQALEVLSRQIDSKSAQCAQLLTRDLERGLRLSEALARLPESFSESYVGIIQAGEASGTLPLSLSMLATAMGKQMRHRQALKNALMYPVFLLLGCGAMILIMIYFIFPMVLAVTKDSGVDPPAITRALMTVSTPGVGFGILIAALALTSVFMATVRNPVWGPKIRTLMEQRTPPGRFFVRLQVLESTRQLSLLLANGIDLLKSLRFAGKVAKRSVVLGTAYEDIIQRSRMGLDLHESFALYDAFPPMLSSMLAVSSEAGRTTDMLDHFCNALEEDLDTRLKTFSTALEPVMLGILGSVIGVLLIAAFMPIYNLIQV